MSATNGQIGFVLSAAYNFINPEGKKDGKKAA